MMNLRAALPVQAEAQVGTRGEKEPSVAHGKACALSLRDPSTCECECGGRLHGSAWKAGNANSPPHVRRVRSRQRKVRRTLAFTAAVTVTGTFAGLTLTGNFSAPSTTDSYLSTQINVDLNETITTLASLGFGGRKTSNSGTSGSSDRQDCAESTTGLVRQFFTKHPCVQYTAETWTITRKGSNDLVAFSWVEMSTASLAGKYKGTVDASGTGNPPGVSSAFDGDCYASDQQGVTVWTVEVKTTGNAKLDQGILHDAVKEDLSEAYLKKHCTK